VPDPLLVSTASAATQEDLGIEEWRLFRGRGGVYLTGYARGKAVSGLSAEFGRTSTAVVNALRTKVNDGRGFESVNTMGRAARTSPTLSNKSRLFTQHALLDLAIMRQEFAVRGRATQATGARVAAVCGADMATVIIDALLGRPTSASTAADASGTACFGPASRRIAIAGTKPLDLASFSSMRCAGNSRCLASFGAIEEQQRIATTCRGDILCNKTQQARLTSVAGGSTVAKTAVDPFDFKLPDPRDPKFSDFGDGGASLFKPGADAKSPTDLRFSDFGDGTAGKDPTDQRFSDFGDGTAGKDQNAGKDPNNLIFSDFGDGTAGKDPTDQRFSDFGDGSFPPMESNSDNGSVDGDAF
jgi:hypothetical protein